jgi:glycerophosphoryl diester phosphodiesterase
VVSSFYLGAVDLAREYAPGIATGWLTHGQEVSEGAPRAAAHGHPWLNPDVQSALAAGPAGISATHALGLQVSVWTVNDPADVRALAASGVDIVITNVPDIAIAALEA